MRETEAKFQRDGSKDKEGLVIQLVAAKWGVRKKVFNYCLSTNTAKQPQILSNSVPFYNLG